jgi:hypothetical protein
MMESEDQDYPGTSRVSRVFASPSVSTLSDTRMQASRPEQHMLPFSKAKELHSFPIRPYWQIVLPHFSEILSMTVVLVEWVSACAQSLGMVGKSEEGVKEASVAHTVESMQMKTVTSHSYMSKSSHQSLSTCPR